MNFDDAIKAHSAWKMKLSNYIQNPDKSLDHNTVCKDNMCDLGKWIYGEGAQFSKTSEYSKLKLTHADFHKEAANIIQRADTAENVKEELALGSKSKFITLSNEIVSLLMQMRRIVDKP